MTLQRRIVASPFYCPDNISAFQQRMHTRCNSQCCALLHQKLPFSLSLSLSGRRERRKGSVSNETSEVFAVFFFVSVFLDRSNERTYHSLPCGEIQACVPALGQSRGRGEGRARPQGKAWHSSSTLCKTTAFGHGYL